MKSFNPRTRTILERSASIWSQAEFDVLQGRILSAWLDDTPSVELHAALLRIAKECAALAKATSFPTLVFPVLFEEKAQRALADSAAGA